MKVVVERLADDLDPAKDADETVKFGLDGKQYEIDLTRAHARELRGALERFIDAGRMLTRGGFKYPNRQLPPDARRAAAQGKVNGSELSLRNKAIREWADRQDLVIPAFGRIVTAVIEAYDIAHEANPDAARVAAAITHAKAVLATRAGKLPPDALPEPSAPPSEPDGEVARPRTRPTKAAKKTVGAARKTAGAAKKTAGAAKKTAGAAKKTATRRVPAAEFSGTA